VGRRRTVFGDNGQLVAGGVPGQAGGGARQRSLLQALAFVHVPQDQGLVGGGRHEVEACWGGGDRSAWDSSELRTPAVRQSRGWVEAEAPVNTVLGSLWGIQAAWAGRGAARQRWRAARRTVAAEGQQRDGRGVLARQAEGSLPAHALVKHGVILKAGSGQEGAAVRVPCCLAAAGGGWVQLAGRGGWVERGGGELASAGSI
jgi:hypothetical protein